MSAFRFSPRPLQGTLLLMMAFSSISQADLVCPGFPVPCFPFPLPCPLPSCTEDGNPSPCCFPTNAAAPVSSVAQFFNSTSSSTTTYSNILQTSPGGSTHSLMIVCPTVARALLEQYQEGRKIGQRIVRIDVPNRPVTIELSRPGTNLDYFRLYVDQETRSTGRPQPTVGPRPSIFHVMRPTTAGAPPIVSRLPTELFWDPQPVPTLPLPNPSNLILEPLRQ